MSDREILFEEAFNLLCGDVLGTGIHRKVYTCRIRPDLVVKVDLDEDKIERSFANVHEYSFWEDYKEVAGVKQWLAPCEMLSPDGRILLQKRAEPIPASYKLPAKLPAFLTDTKRSNYGLLNGKLVCVDYALVVMNPETKLRKATWRNE